MRTVAYALLTLASALSASAAAAKKEAWGVRGQLPLSLEPLFDNDAISAFGNRADANFDCPDHPVDIPGSAFPAEYLPSSGSKLMLDGIWFLFPSKEPGDLNNLGCGGQRIKLPPGRYKALHLIGASENGSFSATLDLAYKEGPAEAKLSLTDWCQKPGFGERVAFEAAFRSTYSSARGRVVREEVRPRLFVQTLKLDPAKTLEELTLPYSRRMHLFAATLEAVEWDDTQSSYASETAEHYASLSGREEISLEDLGGKLTALAQELETLAAAPGKLARQFGWLRTQVAYCQHLLGAGRARRAAPRRVRAASRQVRTIRSNLRALRDGNDPFRARRGCFLRSYRSALDGSLQSYSIAVPNDYAADKPFPLIVSLHGHGWYRPFQGHPQQVVEGVIIAGPHGRGSIDYMLIGEGDVLAVIDDVLKDYSVDPDRIVLEGHSMGGTGSWQLGVHHPDRFAALAPVCGSSDRRAWEDFTPKRKRPRPPIPPQFKALREHVLDTTDPITYAGNLLNLPAFCGHGARDDVVPVGNSRNMAARLKELACPITYHEFARARHWGFSQRFYNQRWDWMMAQRRKKAPERVRYKTASLRHGTAYWVRIDRFARSMAFADIDARHNGEGRFEVKTSNVAAFTLDIARSPAAAAKEIEAAIDGQSVKAIGAAPTFVRNAEGKWAAAPLPDGLAKKKGLEGPVGSALLSSFLLVRGTLSADPWEREVIRRQVDARVRDWQRMYNCRPRVKDDVALTDDDIQRHHLVLYGGPAANAATAHIARKLPIRIEKDRITVGERAFQGPDVGVKLCYPNPLNPRRLVVVFAGLSPAALDQINNRFGNWFGWGPYDNYDWFDYGVFDARTASPETFLCVGFFDPAWRLDEKTQFLGDDAARQARQPHRVPARQSLAEPIPETLHLCDLAPTLIDQHKGAVGFRRSFQGNRLELGDRLFDKGLGVRPPATVEYQLDAHYALFRATVGIDLEGDLDVSPRRARGEWVQFLVFGDGKRLYSSEWLQWDSKPVDVEVEIKDVKTLRLEVDCSNSRWLIGSTDWANARVSIR